MYGVVGLTICRHGAVSAAHGWMRNRARNLKIIFIGQSMRKLLPRSVRPTQREQTIVTNNYNISLFLVGGVAQTLHVESPEVFAMDLFWHNPSSH